MKSRKLVLKKESLAELASDDLSHVVGGTHMCLTVPVNFCLSIQVCQITHELVCLAPSILPDTCLC